MANYTPAHEAVDHAFAELADAVQRFDLQAAAALRRAGRIKALNRLLGDLVRSRHAPHADKLNEAAMREWENWRCVLDAAVDLRAAVWAFRKAKRPSDLRWGNARLNEAHDALENISPPASPGGLTSTIEAPIGA